MLMFTLSGLLIPWALYADLPTDQRSRALGPAVAGAAVFIAFGLLVARKVRPSSAE
jgi:hypothetical protein